MRLRYFFAFNMIFCPKKLTIKSAGNVPRPKKNIAKNALNKLLGYAVTSIIELITRPQGINPKIIPIKNPCSPKGFRLKLLTNLTTRDSKNFNNFGGFLRKPNILIWVILDMEICRHVNALIANKIAANILR